MRRERRPYFEDMVPRRPVPNWVDVVVSALLIAGVALLGVIIWAIIVLVQWIISL